jgi:hypothetical protein
MIIISESAYADVSRIFRSRRSAEQTSMKLIVRPSGSLAIRRTRMTRLTLNVPTCGILYASRTLILLKVKEIIKNTLTKAYYGI